MDNNESCDQLIVRVWKACNFWCNFCNVSDNEGNVKMKENIEDIVRNFHYKLKYSNYSSGQLTVTISWGEPTLFKKETIFALKYIRKVLERMWVEPIFEIQTNASHMDLQFAKIIAELWVRNALVSFHMTDKNIFDSVIQVSYESNYSKIIDWIENLHNAWIDIYTNTILTRETQDNFFETIQFLARRFPFISIFHIGIVQPHGDAQKILERIYPRYEEVAILYNRAIFFLKNLWKEVVSHFVGLPACYMSSLSSSLEVSQNILFRKNYNFTDHYLINNINDNNKKQIQECNTCLYSNVCSWIWNEYVWLQHLNPTNYIKDFFGDFQYNEFAYKIDWNTLNLKKLFDKNIRQVMIPTSSFDKEALYGIIKNCTTVWFYKITLLVDSKFALQDDIFYTWVTNIQIHLDEFDIDFIDNLIAFSKKNTPQFRIDLDIFVTSRWEFEKLNKIIEKLPSPFIHIYFVYDFAKKNYDIFLYKDIIKKLKITGSLIPINFRA